MESLRAVVTDGLWRKSLSAIRSLGKAGYDVTVFGNSPLNPGLWSTYAHHRRIAPFASEDPARFGEALLGELRAAPGSVLFPMEDPTLEWVSANREKVFECARLLIPDSEALRIAQDKAQTMKIATELGLPCPRSWEPEYRKEFLDLVLSLKLGTFIVKPRKGSGSSGVSYGKEMSEDGWKSHWDRFGPLLVQERVPSIGRGKGVSLLFDSESECVAAFAHERVQQYPNSGGPSTDRVSILDPELIEQSIRLLKKLRWKGVAMVEWKMDPRDRIPKLMEINPRFWGSLELAIRSGVDFPLLYARAARGEKLPPPAPYRPDVRCRWMIPGEILRFATQHPSERETFLEFFRDLPELAEEWDGSDYRGTFSTVLCTGLLALNPRFWKYLRRG